MKFCYLIGYSIGYSLSPKMHNSAFRELGIDYRYEAVSVEPDRLDDFLNGVLRRSNVRGANVTIPHKITVIRNLDEVDHEAVAIGAVNTIVNDDGILKGYNTDGLGALKALKKSVGELYNKRVVLLGAGGAARAVAYYLAREAKALTILNRNVSKASKIVESLKRITTGQQVEISAAPFDEKNLRMKLRNADILINATPIGMHPNTDKTPIPRHFLHNHLIVFDLVYNPQRTRLLTESEEAGAETISGLEMLVYQGAESFFRWTGKKPSIGLMLRVVKRALEE